MEALTSASAYCPKCGLLMYIDGHRAMFCGNMDCKLYNVAFERPTITLKVVKPTEYL